MRPVKFAPQPIIESFYRHKVLTKSQLMETAGCSNMTAWRVLSSHGYITSYNFNAKYYTLADIPVFDQLGLWSYRKIRFSRYGSLTDTVTALVCNSTSGLAANELEDLLAVNVTPTLTKLYRQDRLHRQKVGSVFVYLHAHEQRRQLQLNKRHSHTMEKTSTTLPEPERIIAVLVELIQRVKLQPHQIAQRLSRKGIQISTAEIQAIFLHYQLAKKNRLNS